MSRLLRTVLSCAVSGGPSVTNTAPLVVRAVDLANPHIFAVDGSIFSILVSFHIRRGTLVVVALAAVGSVTTVSFITGRFELSFLDWAILNLMIWAAAAEAIAVVGSSTVPRH